MLPTEIKHTRLYHRFSCFYFAQQHMYTKGFGIVWMTYYPILPAGYGAEQLAPVGGLHV